ncbi:hypothetical protein HRbin22_00111 [Candidatus Thermoflexus japonica]|uniref:DUF4340 domain-containing protein n=1 Tax=Candidatus Thermoflexus japonica TaxID=2035417 RepID=A0A2H5Y364_9CHLR|nr:hypothetical protein HRbin22_00111 [Candidatus Thermoflexus japonica]
MKRWGTLGLVIAFLVLALFVYLEPKITARSTPTPEGASRNLLEVSSASIQRIRVIDHANRLEAEVERDASGQWFLTVPTRHLVRQDTIDTLAGGLATLFVQQVISDVTDLSAYGLVTPTYTIVISATDRVFTLTVGAQTPIGGGYYVRREGDPAVYVVGTFAIDEAKKLITQPPLATPTPTPTITPTPTVTPTPTAGPSPTPAATPTP